MFFTVLLIAIVLVAIILYLPYSSGLTKVNYDKKKSAQPKATKSRPVQEDEYQGYIPPDELERREEAKAHKSMKDRMNFTSDDVPFKIRLDRDGSGLRKRKEKLDINRDPNSYDYDIDELLEEEKQEAKNAYDREFYKNQNLGGQKEDVV